MFEQVLVPLDGSHLAEVALPAAEEVAKRFGAKLFLLQVVAPPDLSAWMAPDAQANTDEDKLSLAHQERAVTQDYLSAQVNRLVAEGIAAEAFVKDGDPAEEILALINTTGISLLVMATHGRGGLEKLIFGSVVEKVAHHCQIPVLLVHAAHGLKAA